MLDLRDPAAYIEGLLHIKTKTGEIVPFRFNYAQRRLYRLIKRQRDAGRPVRVIILKARQLGFSTLVEGLLYQDTATHFGVDSLIVAHSEDSTSNLFSMSRLFYETSPPQVRPMLRNSNARELRFENPTRDPEEKKRLPGLRSRIRCVTAGGKGIGRSYTLRNVHLSEFAFWEGDKKEILTGILQAVPSSPGTMVIIESTANGFNEFHGLWEAAVKGESDFIPFFAPWYEEPAYSLPVPPGTVWTADELELAERYKLRPEQLSWRRWCIKNNCSGSDDLFRQEYPSCPDEAFLLTGTPVFDNETIMQRREAAPKPVKRGEFTYIDDGRTLSDIRFVERDDGIISIYKLPEDGRPYVIGGDTAGEGSDYFTAQVLDNASGRQVAVLRHRLDEDLYAKQLYCLGMYYNTALIGVETNYSTYPVRELERLRYPRQYVRETMDSYTHKMRQSFGFDTNSATRPVIIAELVKVMRDTPELVVDFATLGEMLTFVYNDRRRPEAAPGEHDDLVMALAIAHFIRPQQTYTVAGEHESVVVWSRDMWEDYNRASPEEKQYLLKKWGKPKR